MRQSNGQYKCCQQKEGKGFDVGNRQDQAIEQNNYNIEIDKPLSFKGDIFFFQSLLNF